eukprot:Opistho-2@6227
MLLLLQQLRTGAASKVMAQQHAALRLLQGIIASGLPRTPLYQPLRSLSVTTRLCEQHRPSKSGDASAGKQAATTTSTTPPSGAWASFKAGAKKILGPFMTGSKALYNDYKKMRAIKRKLKDFHGDRTKLTREELIHLWETPRDVRKTLPLVIFFWVPTIGYLSPLLGYFFPKQLLSKQFWTPEQKEQFASDDFKNKVTAAEDVIECLRRDCEKIARDHAVLRKVLDTVTSGGEASPKDLLALLPLFMDALDLKNLPVTHLRALASVAGKSTYLPVPFILRRRISMEASEIAFDDLMLLKESADLPSEDARIAAHRRGIASWDSAASASTAVALHEWMEMSRAATATSKGRSIASFLAHVTAFNAVRKAASNVSPRHTTAPPA